MSAARPWSIGADVAANVADKPAAKCREFWLTLIFDVLREFKEGQSRVAERFLFGPSKYDQKFFLMVCELGGVSPDAVRRRALDPRPMPKGRRHNWLGGAA